MDMAFHSSFDHPDSFGFGESVPHLAVESAIESGAVLRPLGWAELCARLVASQDFRAARTVLHGPVARAASFHGAAAKWLAALDRPSRTTGRENELAINPNPSVAGKAVSGIASPQAGGATPTASAHRTESEMSA